jgi:hypothetical protein
LRIKGATLFHGSIMGRGKTSAKPGFKILGAGFSGFAAAGNADIYAAKPAFKGVQGWPISSLILKDILAFLCKTV